MALCVVAALILPVTLTSPPRASVRSNAEDYETVVRLIREGQIRGGSIGGEFATLPSEYRHLSQAREGRVIIYRSSSELRILFYPLGNWVYMYSLTDQPMDLAGECSGQERDRPHWFWFHCP
jgi:hypothetical protein